MKKLLIANRGEIARRIMHTAQRMGIATVAVYSAPDAQALHVREAGAAVALGGAASGDSYLRMDKLLAAARASGADALHPGYGFLSENADFAQAVIDSGLLWIGPPPAAIRAVGSKANAKALAAALALPCLPGYAGADQSAARFAAEAAVLGYPLMVKAVAGGGGRGLRLVSNAAQLPAALDSARAEALAGFGCGELLLERALTQARHVEVQVLADAHGACIHLGERDCSVQRRQQKLIEESPSPAVNAALRARLGACAVALARAAGYVGAGTVEFLLDGADFYLLEMNTRLQVEHPVTEALTGLDLVEWQIRIARGQALALAQHQIRLQGHAIEARLCAEDAHFLPHTGRVLYFDAPVASAFAWGAAKAAGACGMHGDSGACADNTKPAARAGQGTPGECPECAQADGCTDQTEPGGRSDHMQPGGRSESKQPVGCPALARPALARLRFDHALEQGAEVSPHYDSLLGKLIVHAPTRDQAIAALLRALHGTSVLGLPSNRALLAACLEHAQFRSGQALLSFLPEQAEALRESLSKQEQQTLIPVALSAIYASKAAACELPCTLPRPLRLRHQGQVHTLSIREQGAGRLLVERASARVQAQLRAQPGGSMRCTLHPQTAEDADGAQITADHCVRTVPVGELRWHWQAGAIDGWLEDASWEAATSAPAAGGASELRAPFNGRVIALPAAAGQTLAAGDTVVVIESMKLEHRLSSPTPARLTELLVAPGQQVAPGQLLARLVSCHA